MLDRFSSGDRLMIKTARDTSAEIHQVWGRLP
jgi:hypothetical protein